MGREPAFVAFRAQLVIPEQRQLFDYWVEKSRAGGMPGRRDIAPADIPRLLPHVSLLDVLPDSGGFRYRLAGSRLREVFDREVTGTIISAASEGGKAGYWFMAHERVVKSARPVNGAMRGARQSKEHLVQFWLRLPLSTRGDGVDMILGHDVCVPVGTVEVPGGLASPDISAAIAG
jgi:hypothetical protein